jgi:uncharacterized protein
MRNEALKEQELARLATEVVEQMRVELTTRPPTIGLIGVSGVGKSATINAMFRAGLHVSHTVAGTRAFTDVEVAVPLHHEQLPSEVAQLQIVDAPGLGEDVSLDPGYLEEYGRQLGRCDVILWVMSARNRAVALDQQYLARLAPFHERMVFGLNQADLVEPCDWNDDLGRPSTQQLEHLDAIERDRAARLAAVLGREISLVSYSAQRGWNLLKLFVAMLEAAPDHRRWIFDALRDFEPFGPEPRDPMARTFYRIAKRFTRRTV